MKSEPVLTTASITAAATAIIALIVAFGVDLTEAQSTAILGVVGVIAPLVVILARRYVWSEESHQADKQKAVDETARAYGFEDVPDADA